VTRFQQLGVRHQDPSDTAEEPLEPLEPLETWPQVRHLTATKQVSEKTKPRESGLKKYVSEIRTSTLGTELQEVRFKSQPRWAVLSYERSNK
jgi:hypothetical protein